MLRVFSWSLVQDYRLDLLVNKIYNVRKTQHCSAFTLSLYLPCYPNSQVQSVSKRASLLRFSTSGTKKV